MELNADVLDRVSELAHLELSTEKKAQFLEQLKGILNTMDHMNSLQLDAVDPNEWTHDQSTPMRQDRVVPQSLSYVDTNAPKWEDHAFHVPNILGTES